MAGDHPRIRGEHQTRQWQNGRTLGSSPHTRGARRTAWTAEARRGIIPAYAGSTDVTTPPSPDRPDHPRIRGEHHDLPDRVPGSGGSSPHTRGARRSSSAAGFRRRIIPAYAGSTCDAGARGGSSRGSSPHTRGARDVLAGPDRHLRIIPAYAGSTRWFGRRFGCWADHPRIRGEHVMSSPLRW